MSTKLPLDGKHLLAFFRKLADKSKVDAGRLAFLTETSLSMEKETDSQVTADGIVNSIADGENTIEFTSLADSGSKDVVIWKQLRQSFIENDVMECWLVDYKSKREEQYDVDYFQGQFTSFELSAPADGKVELTFTFTINGNGLFDQRDTLTPEQEKAVKAAQYAYETLAKTQDI